jgi:hypothetical protein
VLGEPTADGVDEYGDEHVRQEEHVARRVAVDREVDAQETLAILARTVQRVAHKVLRHHKYMRMYVERWPSRAVVGM